ncbi:MAG: FAD:protein FMN transferase [Bacilli bacterium]|nr:FAD:protein FMN transferase [Bacilli bacterium]
MKKLLIVFSLIFIFLMLIGCDKDRTVYSLNFPSYFNTANKVEIAATSKDEGKIEDIYDDICFLLDQIDKMFNAQEREDGYQTEIMKINNSSGIAPVEVSYEVIYVLNEALKISELSEVDGIALFDPTIAPVWDQWNFIDNYYSIYDPIYVDVPTNLEEYLPLVDYKNIVIDTFDQTVYLKEKGMKLDLGGIVKGYAADCVYTYLTEAGITSAVIDIGKNILLLGSYWEKDWTVFMQTPYIDEYNYSKEEKKYYYGQLYLSNKTIVTSGIYEKYVMDKNGNRYHHILDPRTGFPFANEVVSVSVITTSSIEADGLSTTLFALGLEKGMKIVEETKGLDAIYVVKDNDNYNIYISSGLKDVFVFNQNVSELGYIYKGVFGE